MHFTVTYFQSTKSPIGLWMPPYHPAHWPGDNMALLRRLLQSTAMQYTALKCTKERFSSVNSSLFQCTAVQCNGVPPSWGKYNWRLCVWDGVSLAAAPGWQLWIHWTHIGFTVLHRDLCYTLYCFVLHTVVPTIFHFLLCTVLYCEMNNLPTSVKHTVVNTVLTLY